MKLSKRQTEVLEYIIHCWREGWLPSHRCIAAKFDMAWGTVWKHVTGLKAKGYLTNAGTRTPLRLTAKSLEMARQA